jgi:hypothetical protein
MEKRSSMSAQRGGDVARGPGERRVHGAKKVIYGLNTASPAIERPDDACPWFAPLTPPTCEVIYGEKVIYEQIAEAVGEIARASSCFAAAAIVGTSSMGVKPRQNAKSCAGLVSHFQTSSMDIDDIYGADTQGRLSAGILHIE